MEIYLKLNVLTLKLAFIMMFKQLLNIEILILKSYVLQIYINFYNIQQF